MANEEIDDVPWFSILMLSITVCILAVFSFYDDQEEMWGDPNPIVEFFEFEEPILTRTLQESDIITASKLYVKNY